MAAGDTRTPDHHPTEFRNPAPTVDLLLELRAPLRPGLVLIRRANPPLGWALPGGFVDEGETVETAAVREGLEETGLQVRLDRLLYVYSDPRRDPRRHTLSVVFTATAEGAPVGMDDAAEARLFSLAELTALAAGGRAPDGLPLVFDHAHIVADWLHYKQHGELPRPNDGRRYGDRS